MILEQAKSVAVKGDEEQLKQKYVEEISYVGDLRLVGLVYQDKNSTNSDPIGYVVFVEKTNQTRTVQLPVLLSMYARYKFSNIEIGSTKQPTFADIVCTECAKEKLLRFTMERGTLASIDGNSMYIIGTIFDEKDRKQGYRVLTNMGKVADISMEDTKKYMQTGVQISNMHTDKEGNISSNKQDKTIKIVVKKPILDKSKLNNYGNLTTQSNKDKYLIRLASDLNYMAYSDAREYMMGKLYPQGSYAKYAPEYSSRQLIKPKTAHELNGELLLKILKTEVFAYCKTDAEKAYFKKHYKDAQKTYKEKNQILNKDMFVMVQFLYRNSNVKRFDIRFRNVDEYYAFVNRNTPVIPELKPYISVRILAKDRLKYNIAPDAPIPFDENSDGFIQYKTYPAVDNRYKYLSKNAFAKVKSFDKYEQTLGIEGFFEQMHHNKHRAFSDYLEFMLSPENLKFIKKQGKCFGDFALAYHFEHLIKCYYNFEDFCASHDMSNPTNHPDAIEYAREEKAELEFVSIVGSVCAPEIYKYYKNKYPDAVPNVDTKGLTINSSNNNVLYKYYKTGFMMFYRPQEIGKEGMKNAFEDLYAAILPFASENLCGWIEEKLNNPRITRSKVFRLAFVMWDSFDYNLDERVNN